MMQTHPTSAEARVSLEKCPTYASEDVEPAIRRSVDALGGIGRFVKHGQSVLIKPNMLKPASPSQAVNTHPAVVETIARLVTEAGGRPFVGDSPALTSLERVAAKSGIAEAVERSGAKLLPFVDSVPSEADAGRLFKNIEIASAVLNADVVINVPKLKTHAQMLMTLAVKNTFGCVVGRRKAQWHMRAGRDCELFARVIVEICREVRPALNIVDAVTGMEGNGPGSGTPVDLGFVAASEDPVALDAVLCDIVGIQPEEVYTTRASAAEGFGVADLDRIETTGAGVSQLKPGSFSMARRMTVEFGPRWLNRLLGRHLRPTPAVDPSVCKLCGLCVEACPADAIRREGDRIDINTADCISCFCCQEICPKGAISAHQSRLARVLFR